MIELFVFIVICTCTARIYSKFLPLRFPGQRMVSPLKSVCFDFAAILYTNAPPNGESDEVEPMDTIPLERNMMLTVPAGWKLGQLAPKQPTANHGEFVKIILSEIARCVVTTYGTLAGDFSRDMFCQLPSEAPRRPGKVGFFYFAELKNLSIGSI